VSAATALVKEVLVEALGSSATPFVPVPFVDEWIFARLLRRIAKKVLARRARPTDAAWITALVASYTDSGTAPLGQRAFVGAARFVIRKVAVVLDVKKSHDVFGEAIAFAVALDLAAAGGWTDALDPRALGAAIHRTVSAVGSGLVDTVTRAGRSAWSNPANDAGDTRLARIAAEIAREIDLGRDALNAALHRELRAAAQLRGG
jgi:hypothetical protein